MIVLKDLAKSYPGFEGALRSINYKIEQGDRVGVIGPNGSGKTTLLKIITGLVTPTEGSVQTKSPLSWVPSEDSGLFMRLTGLENLEYFRILNKVDLKFFDAELAAWKENETFNRALGTEFTLCSKGMKRMLLIAQAWFRQSAVVVMDEPFHGIDGENLKFVIEKLTDPNRTIIFSAHNREQVDSFATTILDLRDT